MYIYRTYEKTWSFVSLAANIENAEGPFETLQ
jgi:hypothetical protein